MPILAASLKRKAGRWEWPARSFNWVYLELPGKTVKDRYKFFGEIALENRFVTSEQLYEALTLQARSKVEGGQDKLLGQILLELGYMTEDQIREVLDILYPVKDT